MNPFQFQAQMIEAWATATRTMFTTAIDMWSQAAGVAKPQDEKRTFAIFEPAAPAPALPMWPLVPFPQAPAFAAPMATTGAGWPFGAFNSFGNPFGNPFSQAFTAPNAFSNPFAWLQMMGMPQGVTGWPMAFMMAPPSMVPFSPFSNPWLSMGMFGGQPARVPETFMPKEFLEQMATSYRTASGYAAAAVMGPFGAPLPPKEDGVPFWMLPAGKPRRDVN